MQQLCDQPGCNEDATHTYTFDWGKSGTCCAKHQVTLQQTAANLERTVTFAAISAAATPPLQREERVRLRAEAMVAQEELAEIKQRGLELYNQNKDLISQVQSLTVRLREADAQLKDAIAARDAMDQRLAAREAENAELATELGRLRVLVPDTIAPPPPQPVVEGQ